MGGKKVRLTSWIGKKGRKRPMGKNRTRGKVGTDGQTDRGLLTNRSRLEEHKSQRHSRSFQAVLVATEAAILVAVMQQ